MNDFIQTISQFSNQWAGTALSKLFLLFLGILVCILVVAAIWDRRIKTFTATIAICLGLLLVGIALWESLAVALGAVDSGVRVRVFMVLVSICALGLTVLTFVKTGLHSRYGLLWSAVSLLVLLIALFPEPLEIFPSFFGVNFTSTIAVLSIFFLLLLVFHFSIVISELRDKQQWLHRRISELEHEVLGRPRDDTSDNPRVQSSSWKMIADKMQGWDKWRKLSRKTRYGTSLTAPITVFLIISAVVCVGMLAPQVMIGDEVTHYYMMETQSRDLALPNFIAEIPTGWGDAEIRHYPHSFLWHYFAACVYRVSNGSFFAVQLFHSLFLAQLLWVAYLLAASRGGVEDRSALLYLLLIGSLPMVLIFSVAFYQDVPMTAQILTAFYLLRRERWLPATFFLCLALGMKVSAILFFPAFFICLILWALKRQRLPKAALTVFLALTLVCGFTWGFGEIIHKYSGIQFYPVQQAEKILDKIKDSLPKENSEQERNSSGNSKQSVNRHRSSVPSEQVAEIIANHPGDLRIPVNYFIYGGILIYLTLAGAVLSFVLNRFQKQSRHNYLKDSSIWLWGSGLSYIVLVAFLLKTSPDARFFLPGVVFCALPLAERMVRLPWPRLLVMVFTALALMQAGYSLAKTFNLRYVRPDLTEAIQYLQEHPPSPDRVFMYPEGNYRLFPVPHEWYLGYYLRDFWRADNTKRIEMLDEHAIGAIVIKKYLVGAVDEDITNLGIYPVDFVDDIESDSRFTRVFENNAVVIYQVP